MLYSLAYYAQYHRFLLRKIHQKQYLPVLSFHRVSTQKNFFWAPLPPALFETLLRYLLKHFQLVTFHTLPERRAKKPPLIITFDDGYYDFIEYAMPILDKYQVCVNHNVIPSQLLGGPPLWNTALYDFLNAAPLALLRQIKWPGLEATIHTGHPGDRIRFGLAISRFFKQLPRLVRQEKLHDFYKNYADQADTYPITRMIQLSEMSSIVSVHEIGAHAYSHENMGQESDAYFIDDVKQCQQFFKTHLALPMDIYAFPNGSYRETQLHYLSQHRIRALISNDCYASSSAMVYPRFNIAAFHRHEILFQSLGVKHRALGMVCN